MQPDAHMVYMELVALAADLGPALDARFDDVAKLAHGYLSSLPF